MDFDVIVLGAGAAGMMCAATAGQRGRRVLLVDHATTLAEKIRISGGGRCNFTNRDVGPRNFLSRNPHFCRSALARYTPRDFIALVERHNISYHERNLGQLFCDDSAQQIIAMLKAECDAAGVQWAMPVTVAQVTRIAGDTPGFAVATTQGTYRSHALVVATGGLSIPKIGATPFGYRLAEQFGLNIVPPKPALVPLALPPEWLAQFGALSGSSFDAVMSCVEVPRGADYPAFREAALITHRGLSGPSILQVSSYWQQGGARGPVAMDLLPDLDAGAWLNEHRRDQQALGALLAEHLPRRFAISFAELHGWTQPLAQLSNATLATIAQTLKGWPIQPSGTLGYAKAEVTLGGVDTDALSQQTLEARSVPGLYFIGEVVDVTGWLGGYNFQWAWASGVAAGGNC
ncbi:MAG: NAD(P)/FAD-dependent oxidoreductase [Burkholderiales bacterium]|nr:NAD(P)/FAD-dependent oxidoreductase [Burkholderiales bacterium]